MMRDLPTLLHGGDRVAASLQAQGVTSVFTLCGGHISPILTGAKARGLRVIDVRDEATAVFAADATGRLTGIPGVAAVTAGPGVTNALTALTNARLAQSPLVLIGGAAPTALQGRGALQDIDQRPLVAPHVKRYLRVQRVADLAAALATAFDVARHGVPGPTFVECAIDLLYDEPSMRHWYAQAAGQGRTGRERLMRAVLKRHVEKLYGGATAALPPLPVPPPAPVPAAGDVARAAERLGRAERPVAVIGSQALACPTRAAAVAAAVRSLGIPVYLSGMARGLLGRDDPLQLRHRRREALREADAVLLAGVPCDFRLDYGRHVRRSATLIAANRSPREARLNRRPDVAVIGDAGLFLEALAQRHGDFTRHAWIQALRDRDLERERGIDRDAAVHGAHVNPLALLRSVEHVAGDEALFVADGGDFVATASYIVRPRRPLAWLDPGVFGTLGVGAGFALGAAMARPGAELWLLLGDGACGWSLAEFDTFVRHRVPVIAVVGNDAGWSQIAREQVKLLGDDVGTVLASTDYDRVAAGFGAVGLALGHGEEIERTLRRAQAVAAAGRPVLVNARLDRSGFREGSISM